MVAMSPEERDQVWAGFRSYVAAMNIPHSFFLTSQYLRLSDYIRTFEETMRRAMLPPGLQRSGESVLEYLRAIDREGGLRETQGYIVIRFDPSRHLTEGVLSTGIGPIDDLINRFSPDRKLTPEEEAEVTRQLLKEAELLLVDAGRRIGLHVERLDRQGVYALAHMILQREIAHVLGLSDIPKEAFRESKAPSRRPAEEKRGRQRGKTVFRVGS